jgi:hypothetical protein
MNKPKKWTEVYPQGTKEGDEEAKFFRCLARNPKYEWRSIAQIVKETGLTRERIEEIIDKYHNNIKPAIVYPHKTNADMWGYWERVPEVLKKDDRSISEKDQDARIDKHVTGQSCVTSGGCGGTCGQNCSCGQTQACQVCGGYGSGCVCGQNQANTGVQQSTPGMGGITITLPPGSLPPTVTIPSMPSIPPIPGIIPPVITVTPTTP